MNLLNIKEILKMNDLFYKLFIKLLKLVPYFIIILPLIFYFITKDVIFLVILILCTPVALLFDIIVNG